MKGLLQKARQRLGILEMNMHVGEVLSYDFFNELEIMLQALSEKELCSEEGLQREEIVRQAKEVYKKYPKELLPNISEQKQGKVSLEENQEEKGETNGLGEESGNQEL